MVAWWVGPWMKWEKCKLDSQILHGKAGFFHFEMGFRSCSDSSIFRANLDLFLRNIEHGACFCNKIVIPSSLSDLELARNMRQNKMIY